MEYGRSNPTHFWDRYDHAKDATGSNGTYRCIASTFYNRCPCGSYALTSQWKKVPAKFTKRLDLLLPHSLQPKQKQYTKEPRQRTKTSPIIC